ncbi:hypothetical protein BT63DRAFT_102958 [Microthyrium microscopicum]|uniref:Stc1 domain-containing protein n=1 Tax=Microthyrium microscopicum TaxID=703497 RepID=A0A6A6TYW1_9PEZI|nr:hypothetical protein BT63DRAFT_102958 [Microthyrium microscopicum]
MTRAQQALLGGYRGYIRCLECTTAENQANRFLECVQCELTKCKDEFSNNAKKDPDNAKCKLCKWIEEHEWERDTRMGALKAESWRFEDDTQDNGSQGDDASSIITQTQSQQDSMTTNPYATPSDSQYATPSETETDTQAELASNTAASNTKTSKSWATVATASSEQASKADKSRLKNMFGPDSDAEDENQPGDEVKAAPSTYTTRSGKVIDEDAVANKWNNITTKSSRTRTTAPRRAPPPPAKSKWGKNPAYHPMDAYIEEYVADKVRKTNLNEDDENEN